MTPIRVYLIDDHHVVRQAVVEMLSAEADVSVVGQSGDASAALDAIERERPDIVIVDLKLPGTSGLAAIREIRSRAPNAGIIVFSMYDNAAYVNESIHRGARGYVLKSASKSDLLRAVRAVFNDGAYFPAEITKPLLNRLAQRANTQDETSVLTPRELQMLEFLAEGQSSKEIANFLSITEATVKGHLKNLYDKLGAADRAHAVAIALRQRIID
jgi:DNA-binding NarL/FixJ family response regulator